MFKLTDDATASLEALAQAQTRFEVAQKEYAAAREALDRCSRSVQAKMPWLKKAVDFHEDD